MSRTISRTKKSRTASLTPILLDSIQYYAHYDSDDGSTVYPVGIQTVYRNDDGSGGEVTSSAYNWVGGTNQIQSMTMRCADHLVGPERPKMPGCDPLL